MVTLKFEIIRTKSKSGKRILFFAVVNGLRISRTNWAVKKEAEREIEFFRNQFDDNKIVEMLKQSN